MGSKVPNARRVGMEGLEKEVEGIRQAFTRKLASRQTPMTGEEEENSENPKSTQNFSLIIL